MTLISDLLTRPESVHRGDFVLRLAEGVTDEHDDATLKDYVVTPSLRDSFDDALRFIFFPRTRSRDAGPATV